MTTALNAEDAENAENGIKQGNGERQRPVPSRDRKGAGRREQPEPE